MGIFREMIVTAKQRNVRNHMKKEIEKSSNLYVESDLLTQSMRPMNINPITCEMLNQTYANVTIIKIDYGFIPRERGYYKTNYSFDTSGLTLFKLYESMTETNEPRNEYLVLKGSLNYNITLEYFKACKPLTAGEVEVFTKFSYTGVIPINSVLAMGKVEQYSEQEYRMFVQKNVQYISSMNGIIYRNVWNKNTYCEVLSNPNIVKSINIPFKLVFKPKKK